MYFLQTVFLILIFNKCKGVIYHLNETEFLQMPPIFKIDEYAPCQLYCTVDFRLVSDGDSELLNMIREYSAHHPTHFNHSELQYGICVTQTCKNHQPHIVEDPSETLEACLNETLWEDYRLKAKVTVITCNDGTFYEKFKIDAADVTVALICVSLLLLCFIGSLQEFWIEKSDQGNKFLSCFSLKRNWRILVAHPDNSDPRLKGLKALYGIRALTMVFVVATHAMMPFVISSENTQGWEEMYMLIKYLGNGTLVVQTFFVMSGFLLAHNLQLYSEKINITVAMLPLKILLRWFRLAPAYLFVLAITATWMRFAGPGPLWQKAIGQAVDDCRRDWWLVLLYLINYLDGSQCMPDTWYLASDMQLTILGLFICVMTKGRVRLLVLALMVAAGAAAAAAHTYFEDLDGAVLLSPEVARGFFVQDATFNHVYKRGHTNLPSYALGMAAGLLAYHWQKTGFDLRKNRKFRYLFWIVIPIGFAAVLTGSVFYADGPRAPGYARAAWAALNKCLFGVIGGIFLVGLVFRVEGVYRGVLSWRVWVTPARLSYCAYILHLFLIRVYTGTSTRLMHVSYLNIAITFAAIVASSFLAAVPVWLFVEAPATNLMKLLIRRTGMLPKTLTEKTDVPTVNGTGGSIPEAVTVISATVTKL